MKIKKIFLVFSSFFLLLILSQSLLAQEPEVPYSGEVPLVPNVRPVIILKGSDYDMGYQHVQQLIQIYGAYYLKGAAELNHSDKKLEIFKELEQDVRKYTPWIIDYLKGMAAASKNAGIPMTFENILAHFASRSNVVLEESDCSGFAAWGSATKDGKLICGGSGDHEIRLSSKYRYRYEIILFFYPESGNNFVLSPPSGGAGHPGMNNKGVIYVHHGSTNSCPSKKRLVGRNPGNGVPRIFTLLNTLRFAKSTNEAKDMVLSVPGGLIGGLWADVNGNALVIESTDNPIIIRKPGDHGERDFIYATNNLLSQEFKNCWDPLPPGQKTVYFPHVGWLGTGGTIGSIGRNFELWNLFHNYHGDVDQDFAKMMWRFIGTPLPYATIDEAVEDYERSQAKHWNAHISQTGNAMVGIFQPDNGNEGLIHVSHGCAVRGNDSPTYEGGVVLRLKPTYSFFELKLAADPKNVTTAAQTRARYDLWNAYQELMKIDYSDKRFVPLDDLLNQAVVEWQKGWFYLDEASEVKGSESVIKYAKAVRCYTRTQCYARQVYNSLVPPATRPENLDLRAWHGNWGDWISRDDYETIDDFSRK
ncbi:MAG TPA: hypothetical protein ENH82_18195 [bacterium]|nr:hypothetical protein [bacterium]